MLTSLPDWVTTYQTSQIVSIMTLCVLILSVTIAFLSLVKTSKALAKAEEIHVIVNSRTDTLMDKVAKLEALVTAQSAALQSPSRLYTRDEWQHMSEPVAPIPPIPPIPPLPG